LLISNERFNIDEDRGLVRVFARLQNAGPGRFRRVEAHATLRSASGAKRGENSAILENLQPGEKRDFALTITSHGRVADVDLEVRIPEGP